MVPAMQSAWRVRSPFTCTMTVTMPAPSPKPVLKQISGIERHLNKLRLVPATRRLRSAVILPLLSKALTVSRAICVLIENGFPAEAFATSRTLLDILFIVRYITNKDTEQRAERYVKYHARVRKEFFNVTQKHFPKTRLRALDPFTLAAASEFKSKGNWTGEPAQARMMALEEDSVEFDEYGKGLTSQFDYEGLYFWTSQHVHATVEGIDGHAGKSGEVFRVRSRRRDERPCASGALFITCVTLCKIFVHACRSLKEEQPKQIQELYKLIRKCYRKKKTV